MAILKCDDLSFAYDGVTIFEGLSFEVSDKDVLCIVGENGVGKSTLVKGILGLKKPTRGSITFENGVRNRIGYLPQQSANSDGFPASVYEVVLSGRLNSSSGKLFFNKEDKKIADRWIDKLGLSGLKNKNCSEISGGQKQRMLLARALCATDKLLLLDEPTASLDPKASEEFYSIIRELKEKEDITILIVSHDVKNSLDVSSHVLHISYTGSLFFGSVSDYRKSDIGMLYLGNPEGGEK